MSDEQHRKFFYTGPLVNVEMLVVMLEKHGIAATQEFVDPALPEDDDLNRLANVFVPAADYDRAHGLFYAAATAGRCVPQVGFGIGIDGSNATYRLPPPRLGEHTETVLRAWLRYDAQTVTRLRDQKLI